MARPRNARLERARRPPRDLAANLRTGLRALILVAAGAVAALIAFQVSAAGMLRSAMPERALRMAPTDAQARANLAARIVEVAQSPDALARARALAQDAIRRDPLQVTAFRVLALADSNGNDAAQVYRLFGFAQRLSRRDQPTQLWLIQDQLRRGRVDRAVHHFDIAIRSAGRTRDALLQMLIAATADRTILPPLRNLLAGKPDWWLTFVDGLARVGPDPRNAVALTHGLLDPSQADQRDVFQTFVRRLGETRDYDLAWQMYRQALGPAAASSDERGLRGGDFERPSAFPPFEWWYAQEPNLWAARESADNGGSIVRLFAQNGAGGEVLRQAVRLDAGRYRLQALAGGVPADMFNRPTISVTCADRADAPPLASGKPAEGQSSHGFALDFAVPQGCAWQLVRVELAGEYRDPALAPWLDNLSLRRQP